MGKILPKDGKTAGKALVGFANAMPAIPCGMNDPRLIFLEVVLQNTSPGAARNSNLI